LRELASLARPELGKWRRRFAKAVMSVLGQIEKSQLVNPVSAVQPEADKILFTGENGSALCL
jgi:hypothetical protein